MQNMPNIFRLVMVGVCPVRTNEAIGGDISVPSKVYLALRRINEIVNTDRTLVIIKNIDDDISADNYSSFFPCELKVMTVNENGINTVVSPCDMANSAIITGHTGNHICPRLILSNNEVSYTYEFKDNNPYNEHLNTVLQFLQHWGYDIDLLTSEQILSMQESAQAIVNSIDIDESVALTQANGDEEERAFAAPV